MTDAKAYRTGGEEHGQRAALKNKGFSSAIDLTGVWVAIVAERMIARAKKEKG